MQLHLQLDAKNVRLPLSHRYALQGMLYHALETDPYYARQIHDRGFSNGSRNYKLFTFGRLSGPYYHRNKEIIFKNIVNFEIRSVDPNLIYALGKALRPGNTVHLFENTLQILNSRIEDFRPNTEYAEISMQSPITVFKTDRNGRRNFFSPTDMQFYTSVVSNALNKWNSYFHAPVPDAGFSFEPAMPPDEIFNRHRIVSDFKRSRNIAYGGCYCLRGDGRLINFLYDAGLGAKNSQGLGMFKIDYIPDL